MPAEPHPTLTPERERELAERIAAARAARDELNAAPPTPGRRAFLRALTEAGESAREELIEHNRGLVHHVVGRYLALHPSLDRDDLVQQGQLGLLRATGSFDPERGYRFSTYAVPWIQRYALEALDRADTIRLSRDARTDRRRLHAARREEPELDLSELAHKLGDGWDVARVDRARGLPSAVSLDTPVGGDADAAPLEELVPLATARDPIDHAEAQQLHARLEAALATLDPRSRMVVRARFAPEGEELARQRIAEALHLTAERVRQIENAALVTLQQRLTDYVPEAPQGNPQPVR